MGAEAQLEMMRRSSPCDLPQGLITKLYLALVPCNTLGLTFVFFFYFCGNQHLRKYVQHKMSIYLVGVGLLAVGLVRAAYPGVMFGVNLPFTLLFSSVGCSIIAAVSVELGIWLAFLRKRSSVQAVDLNGYNDRKIAKAMRFGCWVPAILLVVTSVLEVLAVEDTARRPALLRGVMASVAIMGAAHSATAVWALRGVVQEFEFFLAIDDDLLNNQHSESKDSLRKNIEDTLKRIRTRIYVQIVYPILQAGMLLVLCLDDSLFIFLKVILPAFYLILSLLILMLTVQDIYGVAKSSTKTSPASPGKLVSSPKTSSRGNVINAKPPSSILRGTTGALSASGTGPVPSWRGYE